MICRLSDCVDGDCWSDTRLLVHSCCGGEGSLHMRPFVLQLSWAKACGGCGAACTHPPSGSVQGTSNQRNNFEVFSPSWPKVSARGLDASFSYASVGAFTSAGAWSIYAEISKKAGFLVSLRHPRSSQLSGRSLWVFSASGLQYSPVPYRFN